MRKIYPNAAAALDGLLFDGMLIAAGTFGLCGIPELLIAAIKDAGTKELTIASNNAGRILLLTGSIVNRGNSLWRSFEQVSAADCPIGG